MGEALGQATIDLGADKGPLRRALASAEKDLNAWADNAAAIGARLTGFGAGILTALGAVTAKYISAGDAIDKLSKRTGLSAEAVNELAFVAELGGQNIGTMEVAVRRMQKTMGDAERGSALAVDTLKALGVSMEDVADKSPEDQLFVFVDALRRVDGHSRQAALAQEIFGRSGTALLPIINQSADALRRQREEAARLNPNVAENAERSAELADQLAGLKQAWMGVVNAIGSALADELGGAIETLKRIAERVAAWIRENQDLVVTLAKVGAALLALGGILLTAALAIKAVALASAIMAASMNPLAAVAIAAGVAVAAYAVNSAFAAAEIEGVTKSLDAKKAAQEADTSEVKKATAAQVVNNAAVEHANKLRKIQAQMSRESLQRWAEEKTAQEKLTAARKEYLATLEAEKTLGSLSGKEGRFGEIFGAGAGANIRAMVDAMNAEREATRRENLKAPTVRLPEFAGSFGGANISRMAGFEFDGPFQKQLKLQEESKEVLMGIRDNTQALVDDDGIPVTQ